MRVAVTIDDAALERIRGKLQGRAERAGALRPAFDAVGDDFLAMQRARFAGGAGWEPLSREYAIRKAMTDRSTSPLAGGALERSLTRRRAPFSIRRINRRSGFFGTKNPVANLHNAGTKRMPKRKLIVIRADDRRRWGQIFAGHLAGDGHRGLGL